MSANFLPTIQATIRGGDYKALSYTFDQIQDIQSAQTIFTTIIEIGDIAMMTAFLRSFKSRFPGEYSSLLIRQAIFITQNPSYEMVLILISNLPWQEDQLADVAIAVLAYLYQQATGDATIWDLFAPSIDFTDVITANQALGGSNIIEAFLPSADDNEILQYLQWAGIDTNLVVENGNLNRDVVVDVLSNPRQNTEIISTPIRNQSMGTSFVREPARGATIIEEKQSVIEESQPVIERPTTFQQIPTVLQVQQQPLRQQEVIVDRLPSQNQSGALREMLNGRNRRIVDEQIITQSPIITNTPDTRRISVSTPPLTQQVVTEEVVTGPLRSNGMTRRTTTAHSASPRVPRVTPVTRTAIRTAPNTNLSYSNYTAPPLVRPVPRVTSPVHTTTTIRHQGVATSPRPRQQYVPRHVIRH